MLFQLEEWPDKQGVHISAFRGSMLQSSTVVGHVSGAFISGCWSERPGVQLQNDLAFVGGGLHWRLYSR